MPSHRKTSRKILKKGSRKTSRKGSRKTSRKGLNRGTVKLIYKGKFRKPSSKKWFKHDIIFNQFNPASLGKDVIKVIKNDKDENGNYEDPIVYEPI